MKHFIRNLLSVFALTFMSSLAVAATYSIQPLKHGRNISAAEVAGLSAALRTEASEVLPGEIVRAHQSADVDLRPQLSRNSDGYVLSILRYDDGKLLSRVETVIATTSDWRKTVSQSLRSVIFGRFNL